MLNKTSVHNDVIYKQLTAQVINRILFFEAGNAGNGYAWFYTRLICCFKCYRVGVIAIAPYGVFSNSTGFVDVADELAGLTDS